ncbi:MAG: type II secretion system minor pseudopilin GspI [Gammaproteobacteria bacterium]|nr:type II secretion system minor pseudopilin GspI [Gammaproteobacteria bacterium]
MRQSKENGFTLVEVMVALTIVALSLTAIAASMNQMIDAANSMRERTYASWIAQNKIAELRLANVTPEVSSTSGEVDFANTQWAWRAVVSETGIESFYRVDVSVSLAGSEYNIRTVTGFIGEPTPVGQTNQIWDRGLPSPPSGPTT